MTIKNTIKKANTDTRNKMFQRIEPPFAALEKDTAPMLTAMMTAQITIAGINRFMNIPEHKGTLRATLTLAIK